MTLFSDSTKKLKNCSYPNGYLIKQKILSLDFLLSAKIRNWVSVLLVNYRLLPMAKSDFTLFGIPVRYSLFSIKNIRYNI